MLHLSKTKIFFLILFCFFSLYFSVANFIPENSTQSKAINRFFPSERINYGLDLKGGAYLLMEIDIDSFIKENIIKIKKDVEDTLNEYSDARINLDDNIIIVDNISDEIVKDLKLKIQKIYPNVAIKEKDNQLKFSYILDSNQKISRDLVTRSMEVIRKRVDENGTKEPSLQSQGTNQILLQVPGLENSTELKNIIGKTAKLSFHFVKDFDLNENYINNINSSEILLNQDYTVLFNDKMQSYKVNNEAILTGDMLTDARETYFEGKPAVSFKFNREGTIKFAKITKENVGKVFAIVLDNKVITAPIINTEINGGEGVISGNFTIEEAKELALLLRAGSLPVKLNIVEERTVGPSLGIDSIKNGVKATIYAFIFVIIFMVIYYRLFGFFASIAMFINLMCIIAVLSLIGATLTLPGVAGMILAMAMALDSNVLIFERIKEELRKTKPGLKSIEYGFMNAYRTIMDSNTTSIIVAIFLYIFGSGTVKGFAITTIIGITTSVITSIFLTRSLIVGWLNLSFKKSKKDFGGLIKYI